MDCREENKKTTKKHLEKVSRPPNAGPAFCPDAGAEVKAGFWQTGASLQLGHLGVHEKPFPLEGWAEAAAPETPGGARCWWRPSRPWDLPRAPPASPTPFPGNRKKFDNAEEFSKCLRVFVPARAPGGAHFPQECPGAAPRPRSGPGAGAAGSRGRSVMDLICDLLISPEQIRL